MLPRHPLARHLALLIVIKVAAIAALYHVFFRSEHVDPTPDAVAERLLNAPPAPTPSPRSPAHAD